MKNTSLAIVLAGLIGACTAIAQEPAPVITTTPITQIYYVVIPNSGVTYKVRATDKFDAFVKIAPKVLTEDEYQANVKSLSTVLDYTGGAQ